MADSDDLRVRVDWDRDGTFTGPFDDVTTRVRGGTAGRVEVEVTRDLDSLVPSVLSASGSLVLSNSDRVLNRRNTASPLASKVLPNRPVLVERRVGSTSPGVGGTVHTLFRGRTDSNQGRPDVGAQSVTLRVVDGAQDFIGRTVKPLGINVRQGIRTGDALGLLLDDVGWTGPRDLDPGVSVLPLWWEEGNDVLEAIGRLLTSEGPPAYVTIGPDGAFIFRDRHHRMLDTVSATPQSVWRGSGTEPVLGREFVEEDAWPAVVNDVSESIDVRQVQGLQTVWQSAEDIFVPANATTIVVPVDAGTTFINPQTPVEGVDYTIASGPSLAFSVLTPGASVIGPATAITLTSIGLVGPPTVVRGLRLRAQPIRTVTTVTVRASEAGSQALYGTRGLPGAGSIGPWCSVIDAQAIADQIIADRATPLNRVTVGMQVGKMAAGTRSRSVDRANGVLARQVSHRVKLIAPSAFIASDYYVEGIRHELAGDEDHTATVTLEEVPTGGLLNGTFESLGLGLTGWTTSNVTLTLDNTTSHSGASSARFVTTGVGTNAGIESNRIPWGPGQAVTASAWARADTASSVGMLVSWYNAAGALLSQSSLWASNLSPLNTWVPLTSSVPSVTSPALTASFSLKFQYSGTNVAGQQLWVDDVALFTPLAFDVFRFDVAGQGFDAGRFAR